MAGLAHARDHHAPVDGEDELAGALEVVAEALASRAVTASASMRIVRWAEGRKPAKSLIGRAGAQVVWNSQ
jgi:hypothetical protein